MKIGNIITCINTNENNTHFFINTLTTNKTYKILQIQDNLILIKNSTTAKITKNHPTFL